MAEQAKCLCQNCKVEILVDYVRLGDAFVCNNCLRATIPQIPDGGVIPLNGSHLTYLEFISLLADPPAASGISDYLMKNFNYSVLKIGRDYFILNQQNEAIDRLWLHLKIQQDSRLRGDLYDLAMSLWRS